jgi:predicted metal-dependent hydrolase
MIQTQQGQSVDPHYLGYLECFNRQLYYEAHEVLEQLWLPQRKGPDGAFLKGLIQLAGVFVHLQKGRVSPAVLLLGKAEENLKCYPKVHHGLDVISILALIRKWRGRIEGTADSLSTSDWPKLELVIHNS